MPRIVRSRQSAEDLHDIATYVARDNLDAALRFIDRMDQKLKLLSEFPGLGRTREDLAPGLRGFPVGNYVIFYRQIADGIELVRMLHGARDMRRLFQNE